jgi:aminoglycoside phosphotransferase
MELSSIMKVSMKGEMMLLSLPKSIQNHINGYQSQQEQIGLSGQDVYRLIGQDQTLYLKIAKNDHARAQLTQETNRIIWLQSRLPVPRVVEFVDDGERACLLMTAVEGVMSCDPVLADRVSQAVEAIAEGLKLFQSVPIADCPFDRRRERQIEFARSQVIHQRVDVDDLEPEWSHFSAEQLYQHLLESVPTQPEKPILVHGDYCLPNILINPVTMKISGFIDLGHAGVSDAYTDVALAVRSLIRNWGAEYVPLFFDVYGEPLDAERMYFYKLLDEFF